MTPRQLTDHHLSDPAELVVPARFCGPDDSGNGGWVAGSLAGHVTGPDSAPLGAAAPVTVTLRTPPPLERPLVVRPREDGLGVDLYDDQSRSGVGTARLVASALRDAPMNPDPEPAELPDVSPAQVIAAQERFPGLVRHAYAHCFGCGTERSAQEAVALRPGPLAELDSWWAASWVPCEVSVPIVWAALDCPTGWAAGAADRYLLLGQMTAQVHELPEVGEPCVVFSRQTGASGRKAYASSVLCRGGMVLATADTVWIDAGSPR
ncbi:MAG: hypothetical protein IPI32_15515 [Austwickia sp.]|nr:hypothetical protein [Austwickia sp.]MBK8435589.1 hypothetical protein [Austwickia sp.]